MNERRRISDETWRQSRDLFSGQSATERIDTAESRLAYYIREVRDNFIYGGLVTAGTLGISIGFYFNNGSGFLQKATAIFGGMLVLGFIGRDRESRHLAQDWEEILKRENAISRLEIGREDPNLASAIYTTEGLSDPSNGEITNMKRVVDYLGQQNRLLTDTGQKEQEALDVYGCDRKELGLLKPRTLAERISGLRHLFSESNLMIETNKRLAILHASISGTLITLDQIGIMSGTLTLIAGGFFGLVAAGGLLKLQEAKRSRTTINEILARQTMVSNHPTASNDETLARAVYVLDLHITYEQLTHLKSVLDTLREQELLIDQPTSPPPAVL